MTAQQSTVISADGTTIAYERSGAGPTVVLVSAALADRGDAKRLAALLENNYTVVNYDRRGRGRSGDAETWTRDREIEDIEALIEANGGEAFVFGSSSGAVLALDAATALPGKVRKVFAYEPPVIVDDRRAPVPADAIERVEALIIEGRPGEAVKYFFRVALGASGLMISMMRLMFPVWKQMIAMAQTTVYDLRVLDGLQSGTAIDPARWSGLRVPAVVMVGEKGEPFMHSGSEALVRALPGAVREVLAGGNHSTPIMKPAAVAPAITGFFA